MAPSNKVIITCAVTGAIHTPSMSPYLPVTADQIAEAAIGAAEAGAAIVHLHARDERTGRPDQSPEQPVGLSAAPASALESGVDSHRVAGGF
jgi:3,5-dioxohexanoate:acetyl-CoA acetone transferase